MHYQAHNTDSFGIHTPTTVEFIVNGKGFDTAVVIDNEYEVQLDRRSAITGQLTLGVNEDQIKQQFMGGQYFIVDGEIIDYRLKDNLKFIHDMDAIKSLADTLGFASPIRQSFKNLGGVDKVVARSQTEQFQCNATDSIGGEFDINIGFSWSPFSIDINSYIEMWRLVCENENVAESPLMCHRIPMVSNWKENLDISNQVIRHNFDKIVMPRLAALTTERISMAHLQRLITIVQEQAGSNQLEGSSLSHLAVMQDKLTSAWDPMANNFKSNILKFIPAPVSAFDAMNIATEVSTHHVARDRTNARAQAFVNGLIFDDNRQNNLAVNLDTLVTDSETFGQIDQAFFGVTCH